MDPCPGSERFRAQTEYSWEEYFGVPEGQHCWVDWDPAGTPLEEGLWCDYCEQYL